MSCELCNREYGRYHKMNGYSLIKHKYCPECGEPSAELEPLTLEQLKQRDGQPVYCVGIINKGLNGWGLVNSGREILADNEGDHWDFDEYGEDYVAYDRPPKEKEE